jgi:hypothetical protein
MFASESDDCILNNNDRMVFEDLYQEGALIGHKKTVRYYSGFYREVISDTKNQIMSDIKYSPTGQWVSGKIYKDGNIIKYLETDTDDHGCRHEVEMDAKLMVLSHKKFDKHGHHIGSIIFENNSVIGYKKMRYLDNGDVIETVFDDKYKPILTCKIKQESNSKALHEQNTNSILIEEHEIKIDDTGRKHKIVYDASNKVISDTELEADTTFIRQPIERENNVNHIQTKQTSGNVVKDIIKDFILKIFHIQK